MCIVGVRAHVMGNYSREHCSKLLQQGVLTDCTARNKDKIIPTHPHPHFGLEEGRDNIIIAWLMCEWWMVQE